MTPSIETPRLILRGFVPSDWSFVAAILGDTETTRHMHFARWDEEQQRHWFDICISGGSEPAVINWAIAHKKSGNAIGWFGIGASSHPEVPGERSFGYLLDRGHWNQGYMTETCRAVLAYEFGVLSTPQVRATCEVDNIASWRVMEKSGMRRASTVYDADFAGDWAHRHHYVITKAEYGRPEN